MKDFRIDKIELDHIGAFEHLSLELKPKPDPEKAEIHILTGENGTGKSTVLQAVTTIGRPNLLQTKKHTHVAKGTSKITFVSGPEQVIGVSFVQVVQEWQVDYNNDASRISMTGSQWLQNYHRAVTYGQDISHDVALFAYSGNRNISVQSSQIKAITELDSRPLKNSLDLESSIDPRILLQWVANTKTKQALAFVKGDDKTAADYGNAIGKVEEIISAITSWNVRFELADNPLRIEIIVDGVVLDFSLLPDGLKSIISWVADLLMRIDRISWTEQANPFDRNFILLLDEIEVHLHPAWQRKVLPIIQKLFRNAQIIISTHSPFVTNSVDGAWIYKLKKEGQYSVLDGPPILSEDAKSYRTMLEEIFGIDKEFGPEVERDLSRFQEMKKEILAGRRSAEDQAFIELARSLAEQSIEVESIIGMELKQISRIKKVPLIEL